MTEEALPETFDDLLQLIGRLTYAWANTESLLIHVIAGLAGVEKDIAAVIFLTLNTTRARIDLVERLAKLGRVPADQRQRVLDLTGDFLHLSAVRNRYSHSIYEFDAEQHTARTILMRITDRKESVRIGQSLEIDREALDELDAALASLADLNQRFWSLIHDFGYPL